MSIAITAATGRYGHHAIDALLNRGVPADQIVAIGRNPEKLAEFAARGIETRVADYDDPAALEGALSGVEKLLLISGSEPGKRLAQHSNVVDAAKKAGVQLVAYTSIPRADTTSLLLASEHKATEAYIRESGIPFVFLRNSWYLANYTSLAAASIERGVIVGAAGNGRISGADHADYADAAAVVLTTPGHENTIYELGGDTAFTMTELARTLSEASGKEVVYEDLSGEEYLAMLTGSGLPGEVATVFADSDLGIARGDLLVESGDLGRLIGRPTVTLVDAIAEALRS